MADTVVKHNQLTVQLASALDDPLAGGDNGVRATAGGLIFSASKLNEYLIRAYSEVVTQLVNRVGIQEAAKLSGCFAAASLTMTSSRVLLPADFLFPVGLRSVTDEAPPYRYQSIDRLEDLNADNDENFKREFTTGGGYLYAYKRTNGRLVGVGGDSVLLYYMNADRVNSTTGAYAAINTLPDIQLNRIYHNAAVAYAAHIACIEKGVAEWAEKSARSRFLETFLSAFPPAPVLVNAESKE
jgi:hypothetical protein